jgi:hypothetical protein
MCPAQAAVPTLPRWLVEDDYCANGDIETSDETVPFLSINSGEERGGWRV